MAQRNAVTHDLVFDRILQRGILDYFDDFTPDEAHFGNPVTERAVAEHFGDQPYFRSFQR